MDFFSLSVINPASAHTLKYCICMHFFKPFVVLSFRFTDYKQYELTLIDLLLKYMKERSKLPERRKKNVFHCKWICNYPWFRFDVISIRWKYFFFLVRFNTMSDRWSYRKLKTMHTRSLHRLQMYKTNRLWFSTEIQRPFRAI